MKSKKEREKKRKWKRKKEKIEGFKENLKNWVSLDNYFSFPVLHVNLYQLVFAVHNGLEYPLIGVAIKKGNGPIPSP